MKEILFLSSEFKYRLWGSQRLEHIFHQKLPYEKTGEAWCISAHKNGPSTVLNGKYQGKTLNELYDSNKYLFGDIDHPEFPLLIKIIDANDDLSIQVHPDDLKAKAFNSLGKTECWYILDADKDASIILGHEALTKEAFIEKVNQGDWHSLLRKVTVKKGDFFFIPAGVVHALGKGIMVLETQQSSDITYRLYDYDRKDINGFPRELHIAASLDATTIPTPKIEIDIIVNHMGNNTITTLIKCPYFTVLKLALKDNITIPNVKFTLMTCLEGAGTVHNQQYKQGDSWIVTAEFNDIQIKPLEETLIIASHL